jgi:hypothetical protein
MVDVTILGAAGVLYGIEVSSTVLSEIVFGALDGFVGLCVAVPLAFAINISRQGV